MFPTNEQRILTKRNIRREQQRVWIKKKKKVVNSAFTSEGDIEVFDGPSFSRNAIIAEDTFDKNVRKMLQKCVKYTG